MVRLLELSKEIEQMYPNDLSDREAKFCAEMALEIPNYLLWDDERECFDHVFLHPFFAASWLLRQVGLLESISKDTDRLVTPSPSQDLIIKAISDLNVFGELTNKVIFEYFLVTYIELFEYRYRGICTYNYFLIEEIIDPEKTPKAHITRYIDNLYRFGVLEEEKGKFRWKKKFYPIGWEAESLSFIRLDSDPCFKEFIEDFLLKMPSSLKSSFNEIKNNQSAINKLIDTHSFLGQWRVDGYNQPIAGLTNPDCSPLNSLAAYFIANNY